MKLRHGRSLLFTALTATTAFHCADSSTDGTPLGGSSNSSGSDGGSRDGSAATGSSTSLYGFEISPINLDFGKVNCGGRGEPATVTLRNTRSTSIAWESRLGKATASPYAVEPARGDLAPGATVTLTVTPNAIPALASTADDGFADTLTIADGQTAVASIPLHQTARGAILAFTPTSTAFGAIALSTASSAAIAVVNSGNSDAHVSFSVPGGPPFSVAPAGPTLIAGGGSATVSAGFTPTAIGDATSQLVAAVASGEVLCAPAPTLPVAGTGTNGTFAVDNVSLTFGTNGLVDCGSTAPPQQVTIRNTGSGFFSWTSALAEGASFYVVGPAAGTLAPGTSQPITVTPRAIPAVASVAADAFAGVLTITTSAGGDVPHNIELHETARGAVVTRSIATAAFGTVAVGITSSLQFSYTNTGNAGVVLTSTNANGVFSATSPLTIGAGATTLASASFVPGATFAYSDQSTLQVQGGTPLCAAVPAPLSMTGTGGNSSIGVTPATVAFGSVPCGTQGDAQTVRITNNGPQVNYTTALLRGDGSNFTVTPASASGTIAPGASALVTVVPLPIPPIASTTAGAFNDSLVITTDNPNDTPHVVALTETALGAILAFSKASIAFPDTAVNQTNTAAGAFTLNNTGNMTIPVTLSVSDTTHYDVTQLYPTVTAATNLPATAAFHPASTGSKAATLSVVAGGPLCSPLPSPVTLGGKGI